MENRKIFKVILFDRAESQSAIIQDGFEIYEHEIDGIKCKSLSKVKNQCNQLWHS